MPTPIAQASLNFAASAAGALLAGFAGVWFGTMRTKKDRGFDQRLAWSKDMIQALHGVAKWIDRVSEAETLEEASELYDIRHDRIERFDLLVAEARAYAGARSLAALDRAASLFRQMGELPVPDSEAAFRQSLLAQLNAFEEASAALCDDVRSHLGLEVTTLRSWPFTIHDEIRWLRVPPAVG